VSVVLAYLDPASGSIILQAILGGIAGMAVAFKLFGRRVLTFLHIGKREPTDPDPTPAERETV
jgi:hypothetical protein